MWDYQGEFLRLREKESHRGVALLHGTGSLCHSQLFQHGFQKFPLHGMFHVFPAISFGIARRGRSWSELSPGKEYQCAFESTIPRASKIPKNHKSMASHCEYAINSKLSIAILRKRFGTPIINNAYKEVPIKRNLIKLSITDRCLSSVAEPIHQTFG